MNRRIYLVYLVLVVSLLAWPALANAQQPKVRQLTEQELLDMMMGSSIQASRGNNTASMVQRVKDAIAQGKKFTLIAAEDVPDGWTTVTPAGIGGGGAWEYVQGTDEETEPADHSQRLSQSHRGAEQTRRQEIRRGRAHRSRGCHAERADGCLRDGSAAGRRLSVRPGASRGAAAGAMAHRPCVDARRAGDTLRRHHHSRQGRGRLPLGRSRRGRSLSPAAAARRWR